MTSILGIGNALVDALYPEATDALLAELGLRKGAMQMIDEETYNKFTARMSGTRRERTTGGAACNTILALARLGATTTLIGKIAADDNGRFFSESFAAAGVSLNLITDSGAGSNTGVASAFITPDGQRTFGTYLGAAATLAAADMRQEWFAGHAYFYIEGYLVQNHELIDTAVAMARAAGLKVCLDMASFNIVEADRDFFGHLLRQTDIVFANEDEARAFTGLPPEEALPALAAICPTAIVKVGACGAYARCGAETAFWPASPAIKAVDTTAAGDYFAAGFLHASTRGASLEDCLAEATLLAEEVVQVIGTRLSDAQWARIGEALSDTAGRD